MMQPLNLSRKFREFVAAYPWKPGQEKKHSTAMASVCEAAEHFLLPDNGILLADHELRALPSDENLRLPFPVIVLEYMVDYKEGGRGRMMNICVESPEKPMPEKITVFSWHFDGIQWYWNTPANVPVKGALDTELTARGGRGMFTEEWGDFMGQQTQPEGSKHGVRVMLHLLNALACSNVESEVLPGRKKGPKHKKDALPFDDYRVLTVGGETGHATGGGVGGSHRSPREHLRRGHIVRPEGRRPYWRNATVVNAGVGGRVDKDYRMVA